MVGNSPDESVSCSVKGLRNDVIALNIEGAGRDRPAVQHILSEIHELPSHRVLVTTTTARDRCVLNLSLTESYEESLVKGRGMFIVCARALFRQL